MAGFLKRYTNIMSLADMLLHKRITLLPTTSWKDGNDRRSIELFKRHSEYASVVAMCLTEAEETFHHWQIFAGGDAGICVDFDKDGFCRLFNDEKKFISKPVEYVKLDAIKDRIAHDIQTMPFLKRWGYRAEKEFRVVGFSKKPELTIAVPFDVSIIRRITFSPFIVKQLADSAREILSNVNDCHHIKWTRSTLIENESWTQSLERWSAWQKMPDVADAIAESLKGSTGLKGAASLVDIKQSGRSLKIRK